METNEKQYFIKDLERDLKLKISSLKKEQQVFIALGGLKSLMNEETQKDEVVAILEKLQAFTEKQLAEEIEVYEEALAELQEIKPNEKDMETKGGVA